MMNEKAGERSEIFGYPVVRQLKKIIENTI